jgi:hypothetical protein
LSVCSICITTAGARPAGAGTILQHKEAQVGHLRQIMESYPDRPDRPARLFKLARLELEVAILRSTGARGVDDAGLAAAALTSRRLLATCPGFGRADQVMFFLAQVEMRRGRRKAALEVLTDLGRLHPQSKLRCNVG